ncbi:MAG: zinc-binding dehydrogenase [Gemmatimonadetes bacterium]|nr:zinc-binding dehydrogenase [Gemmatimonadota bacterium]MDA1103898.1 zinc-binding dehydrogenase [Gemmatimonadota bacterium]
MAKMMRAAVFEDFGGPGVVEIRKVPIPEPGPGEVRIKVEAAAMNHLDLWVRRGLPIETPMPHIGGSDIAGTVHAVGLGAEDVPIGTRVVVDPSLAYGWYDGQDRGESFDELPFRIIGEHTQGGFAEYAVVPAENLLEIPDGFPAAQAAAAGLVFVTAWRALITRGRLRVGERVLITGASGGVGTAAVQVADRAGAKVFAVTGGAEKVRLLSELGADIVYDRHQVDFSREVWRDTYKEGVDVVFDTVGEEIWPKCLRALSKGGRLVTSGATTGSRGVTELRLVFWKQLEILGSTMGTPTEFREVMRLVFDGTFSPVIQEILPLDQARRAHEILEAGKIFGKLVLVP